MSSNDARTKEFKNRGLDQDALRRRRNEQNVGLRKQKRDENIQKRRQLTSSSHNGVAESAEEVVTNSGLSIEQLPEMTAMLMGEDRTRWLTATKMFRKLLSKEKTPPIQEVIEMNVVPRLVQFLSYEADPMIQFESAWALTNIASGNAEQTAIVIDAGAVPHFIELLKSDSSDVCEQAVWALGNIAGDSSACRDLVLKQGGMMPLLDVLHKSDTASMTRNATWALSNLCRGKSPSPDFSLVRVSLPVLARLIQLGDEEVLQDACWALSYLSDGNDHKIEAVLQADVAGRLVELLGHHESHVVSPALRTLGNIVTGRDHETQCVLNAGALPQLKRLLLTSDKEAVRKETCWTLSNITAGTKDQIQAVIEADIFPALANILTVGDHRTKKEAAWAVSNAACGGSDDQLRYLVEAGCIQPLCQMLSVKGVENKVMTVILDAIEKILKAGQDHADLTGQEVNEMAVYIESFGGVDIIDNLQKHFNQLVYEKSYAIIETYFKDDEDVSIMPDEEDGSYTFDSQGAGAPQEGFNF
ncbi:importin subunit alpha-2 [Sphaeroforma arctica JP610]|uniref:Importin subunit alpha n=1 Tax=Sphaeroforma arctica JP610 TaxID=667725 RepID=A0A0L0GFN0_9EUKA|nr:importin subunit alpha-2 [Sphaeroforma arctica JP610]KNC87068.1 importin subunit alpha-2 [Sphaeroforma arctica JP610]|eukprot:XP_014160970.1 importin subunit alpha-2 [Sphaeroforma arctica JP610]